jgi:hypothetical protein
MCTLLRGSEHGTNMRWQQPASFYLFMHILCTARQGNMALNLPETQVASARGRGADYEPYFPSDWALASLLATTKRPNRLPDHS